MTENIKLKSKNYEQGERIEALLSENAELKAELDAIDKAGENVRQQINDAFRNKKSYKELEKENAKAKEIIKQIVIVANLNNGKYPMLPTELFVRAENFLKGE